MFKSTLSLCLGYFLNNTQLQVSFIWQRRLSAVFVYVPMNRSRLSMSLSRLPPCIICRFSHLVIWEELTERQTERRLAFNYNQATSWARDTPSQTEQTKITNTLYNITSPTENPSMWKLSIYPLPPAPLLCSQVFNMNQFGSITQ